MSFVTTNTSDAPAPAVVADSIPIAQSTNPTVAHVGVAGPSVAHLRTSLEGFCNETPSPRLQSPPQQEEPPQQQAQLPSPQQQQQQQKQPQQPPEPRPSSSSGATRVLSPSERRRHKDAALAAAYAELQQLERTVKQTERRVQRLAARRLAASAVQRAEVLTRLVERLAK
jgi:hypothetical protein